MHVRQFLKDLKGGSCPPVLTLLGEELELHRTAIEEIIRTLPGEDSGMGMEQLDGNTAELKDVIDVLASGGLFASRRVVIVRNADGLTVPADSPFVERLKKYVENPDPNVTLVFSAASVNKNRYPFRLLVKSGEVVECDPLKGAALKQWISGYTSAQGYQLEDAATDLVTDLLGSDLSTIKNALEKVMIYCDERKRITHDDVRKNLGMMREHAVWELTDAIGARNMAEAVRQLALLINDGKHPLQITMSLQIQFRRLLSVKAMINRKMQPQDIARAAGIRFFVEKVIAQARAFRASELLDAYEALYRVENEIKSAGIDERYIIEKAVIDICNKESAQTASRGAR